MFENKIKDYISVEIPKQIQNGFQQREISAKFKNYIKNLISDVFKQPFAKNEISTEISKEVKNRVREYAKIISENTKFQKELVNLITPVLRTEIKKEINKEKQSVLNDSNLKIELLTELQKTKLFSQIEKDLSHTIDSRLTKLDKDLVRFLEPKVLDHIKSEIKDQVIKQKHVLLEDSQFKLELANQLEKSQLFNDIQTDLTNKIQTQLLELDKNLARFLEPQVLDHIRIEIKDKIIKQKHVLLEDSQFKLEVLNELQKTPIFAEIENKLKHKIEAKLTQLDNNLLASLTPTVLEHVKAKINENKFKILNDNTLRSEVLKELENSELYSKIEKKIGDKIQSTLKKELPERFSSLELTNQKFNSENYIKYSSLLNKQADELYKSTKKDVANNLYSDLYGKLYEDLNAKLYADLQDKLYQNLYQQIRGEIGEEILKPLYEEFGKKKANNLDLLSKPKEILKNAKNLVLPIAQPIPQGYIDEVDYYRLKD